MNTKVLLILAKKEPMPGIEVPKPNEIYKDVQIKTIIKPLNELNGDYIRVEMLYVGICGTDVHTIDCDSKTGYITSTAPINIPKEGRILGHEGVGRVLSIGKNVRNVKVGNIVTFESIISCGTCDKCREGKFNQCRNAALLGLEEDGLMGTVVDVYSKLAHDVTSIVHDEDDLKACACIEPAGVAYVACQNAYVKNGDKVLILGSGPIGTFCAMLCKLIFGASKISVVEPIKYRRELARKWANNVYSPDEFREKSNECFDAVIETSGRLEYITEIFEKIDANGRIALVARREGKLSISQIDHLITNEISIKGSRGHLCGAFDILLRLYESGSLPLKEVITLTIDTFEKLEECLKDHEIVNSNCKIMFKIPR